MAQGGTSGGCVDEPDEVELRLRPEERVRLLASLIGDRAVAAWCAGLLAGSATYNDPDLPSLTWLGGQTSVWIRQQDDLTVNAYWPRVWAARGLLHVWDALATQAIVAGLADDAWRVREMAAKVALRREVGEAADALARLTTDDVPRVRLAALRALGRVGEAEHAEHVRARAHDPDLRITAVAERAMKELEQRLDRVFPD